MVNNTNGINFSCTATSAGGTSTMGAFVKKDDTPPAMNPQAVGTLGNNGWFIGPVQANFNLTEDISGIQFQSGCGNTPVNSDTPGVTFTCTATNNAGLTNTQSVFIKRDTQKPNVNFQTTGQLGANQWWRSDVGVTWNNTDNMSGIGTAIGCDPFTLNTDTPGISLTCTVTDNAGNSQFRTLFLKRDATVPTVQKSVTGTLGEDDWFISDMTLTWTGIANGPAPIVSAPCPAETVNFNTPGILFTCKVSTASGATVQGQANIKRDDTSPTVNAVPSGSMGMAGWFTSDVAVSWMVIPNGPSGASASDCNVSTVNTDTPGTTIDCIAKSGAGVKGAGSITIKRDASTPGITPNLAGSMGDNGWFVSNVDVSWSAVANGPSGASANCNVTTVTADTPGEVVQCTATSGAGLSATEKVTVKKDASTPSVASSVAGTLGTNGWYTSDADVSWQTVANGPSGVSSPCATETLSNNSAGTTFDCSAKSGAGVKATGSVTVKRDASTATVTPTVSGQLGDNGWYTSNVNVAWGVTANGPSGASATGSNCAVSTLSTDTQGVTYECTATTGAGKTSSGSVALKRDATNPVISYSGNVGTYTPDQNVSISCAAADAMSGIASNTCAPISGPAYSFGSGASFSAAARDFAGNASSATATFTVKATAASLCALTRLFVSGPGELGIENSMCTKLEKGNYGAYINEVRAQSGKSMTVANANILIGFASSM